MLHLRRLPSQLAPCRARLMSNLKVLGDDSAFDAVQTAKGKKLYYFTASWCPPCKKIAPVFDQLSKKFPSIAFVKIDVDALPGAAQEFVVRSVPTFVFLKDASKVHEFAGASEELLSSKLADLEKL